MYHFITSNFHKFKEIKEKFDRFGIDLHHKNIKYVELQAGNFEDIAYSSAANVASFVEGDFFLEDAGLEIDALNGFPGPYSSYILKTIGWKGILDLMDNQKNRTARFVSHIVLHEQKKYYHFKGSCEGIIANEGRGKFGFGFDPIFIPIQELKSRKTFAQLSVSEKNSYSHRANSVNQLISFIQNNN